MRTYYMYIVYSTAGRNKDCVACLRIISSERRTNNLGIGEDMGGLFLCIYMCIYIYAYIYVHIEFIYILSSSFLKLFFRK